ncbi:MAG: DNA repair protein RadA [Chloroflexota bacterium]|nr:DNA repair protein RadA [Chloroflexota bacterium]
MAKIKVRFVCQECGSTHPKWMGKCPDCGEWNTLVEKQIIESPRQSRAGRTLMPLEAGGEPQPLPEIASDGFDRVPVEGTELSRVLGGGIVPGSGVLVSGDPGIGKSTLLLQLAANMARTQGKVLYVSGEESTRQIKLRASRLGIEEPNLFVLAEIHLEPILQHAATLQPTLIVVDSVQSIYSDASTSAAGSVSQVRECTAQLLRLAKSQSIPVFLVGHVTKEGAIAGPRVLEHMVDTVLYLEGERFQAYRLLRSVKNRFGSTDEVGVFEMVEKGLREVSNPSEAFLAERLPNAAGSAIAVTMEGTRPLLVEVQALASTTSFAQPRRTANGIDFNRLLLLTAVLGKRVGFRLSDQDLFINVVGGLRINEPAADLAVAISIASSFRNVPVPADLAVVGEVGLSGEIRSVSQLPRRLNEAAKLGFTRCLVPKRRGKLPAPPKGMEVIGVRTLRQALEAGLGGE